MAPTILWIFEMLISCSIVLGNGNESSFNIKDIIDWSKWSTIENQKESVTQKIKSTSPKNDQSRFAIDWSRWDTLERTTESTSATVNQDVEDFVKWLKKSTTEISSTHKLLLPSPTELPRKSKVSSGHLLNRKKCPLPYIYLKPATIIVMVW